MKNKKKIGLIIGLLLTLALLVTACGASAKSNTQTGDSANKDGELKTVKIGATSATAQLSENALLAQNLGYFDDELKKVGYKAEYVGFAQAGPAVNEAFAAGEIDYAIYADFAAIAAKSNKIDIKVVGLANQQMNYALLATQKSGISSWKDIEGKKLIVPTGTMMVHPVRMSGTVIGASQTYEYFEMIQDRILTFVSEHAKIAYDQVKKMH